jgi:hypothetical protein
VRRFALWILLQFDGVARWVGEPDLDDATLGAAKVRDRPSVEFSDGIVKVGDENAEVWNGGVDAGTTRAASTRWSSTSAMACQSSVSSTLRLT